MAGHAQHFPRLPVTRKWSLLKETKSGVSSMGRHDDDGDREVKKEKKEKDRKHKHREKDKDRSKEKSRHRDTSPQREDEPRSRKGRDRSPGGRADGPAKVLDLHEAAEHEPSTIDANGAAGSHRDSPRRREEDERRPHRSGRDDAGRRDRDRDPDRERKRDRSRDRHRNRDKERDRDRRRDGSKDPEKDRASSKPRDIDGSPAKATEQPEARNRSPVRQSTPPMSASARDAEPPQAQVQESGGELSMSIEETNKCAPTLPLALCSSLPALLHLWAQHRLSDMQWCRQPQHVHACMHVTFLLFSLRLHSEASSMPSKQAACRSCIARHGVHDGTLPEATSCSVAMQIAAS